MNAKLNNKLSEYFKCNISLFGEYSNYEYLMSGTAAIDFVLQDIMNKYPNIKDVYLPQYRCYSIELPFKCYNFNIHYYYVDYDKSKKCFKIENLSNIKNTIILLCDFYESSISTIKNIMKSIDSSCVVIRDVTHTLFNKENYVEGCDYIVASVRKWFKVVDAGVVLTNKKLSVMAKYPNIKFVALKKIANTLKNHNKNYILRKIYEWSENKAEKIADEKYHLFSMSDFSANIILNTDFSQEYQRRLINSKRLKKELQPYVMIDGDMLLTIPCFVDNISYDELQIKVNNLRNLGVRCASFWGEDLSLVCEYNICFDLKGDYNSRTMKEIKNILGS